MNILTHEKTIRRNAKIGQYTMFGGFILFSLSLYYNYTGLNDPKSVQQWQVWAMYAGLLIGFIVMQISVYLGNRFGRKPRPHERIATALKGLTKDYTLYNYLTPVNHLLIGPAGVWIIEAYYQRGTIVYEGDKWKQKGGGVMLGYLKIFAQEGLGRPDIEVKADTDSLTEAFKKALGEGQEVPPIHTALVFTDARAEIKADNAPIPTIKIEQLKELMRKTAKQDPFPATEIKRITAILPEESVE
jgi:hypothetical protein